MIDFRERKVRKGERRERENERGRERELEGKRKIKRLINMIKRKRDGTIDKQADRLNESERHRK